MACNCNGNHSHHRHTVSVMFCLHCRNSWNVAEAICHSSTSDFPHGWPNMANAVPVCLWLLVRYQRLSYPSIGSWMLVMLIGVFNNHIHRYPECKFKKWQHDRLLSNIDKLLSFLNLAFWVSVEVVTENPCICIVSIDNPLKANQFMPKLFWDVAHCYQLQQRLCIHVPCDACSEFLPRLT